MNPLVSIIVPTFNSGKTLDACLHSIVAQTYPYKEVVVVDGGSSDQTLSILQGYQSRSKQLTFVSEKDKGIYDAMNKGIDLAKGDYLFFMGSDDEFYTPAVLEKVFAKNHHANFDFLYGNVFFRNAKVVYSGQSSKEKLIGDQVSICHQAIFYKKEIFTLVGKFDLKYFIHADYALNVKCFEHPSVRIKYLNEIIVLYNEHGLSGTQPNKDGFHDYLTLHYITTYVSPFDLILKIKKLEQELQSLKHSRSYLLLHRFSKLVLKMRTVFTKRIRSSKK